MTADNQTKTARAGLVASAFRYSNDPRVLGRFLHGLGLSAGVSNEANTWLEMRAASGSVSINAAGGAGATNASAGTTDLVMVTGDVVALSTELRACGATTKVWDEAFGRQAVVELRGRKICINEEQLDTYGYRQHQPDPGPVTVVTHWFTHSFENSLDLLALLGFLPAALGMAHDQASRLQSTDNPFGGAVCLHQSAAADEYVMGFETTEDLDRVADRLSSDGFIPHLLSEDVPRIEVVDPDGQLVRIEPT